MEALLALAIPAIVKAFELTNQKDWKSLAKIIGAALVGTLAGLFGFEGLTWLTGLAAGLSAAGVVTVAGYAGQKAKTAPVVVEVESVPERKY